MTFQTKPRHYLPASFEQILVRDLPNIQVFGGVSRGLKGFCPDVLVGQIQSTSPSSHPMELQVLCIAVLSGEIPVLVVETVHLLVV